MLSEETVRKLALACRLSLSPQEITQYQKELDALEKLSEPLLFDSVWSDREGTVSAGLLDLREDQVGSSYPRDVILTNPSACENGYILVPRAVEDSE